MPCKEPEHSILRFLILTYISYNFNWVNGSSIIKDLHNSLSKNIVRYKDTLGNIPVEQGQCKAIYNTEADRIPLNKINDGNVFKHNSNHFPSNKQDSVTVKCRQKFKASLHKSSRKFNACGKKIFPMRNLALIKFITKPFP